VDLEAFNDEKTITATSNLHKKDNSHDIKRFHSLSSLVYMHLMVFMLGKLYLDL